MRFQTHETVTLKRDCEAIQIPSGEKVTLFKDTWVTIMQALGGTFTVMTDQGAMASIAGKDADALGKEIPPEAQLPELSSDEADLGKIKEMVWRQLRTCYDPEIPHNIVDLGLVYECQVEAAPAGGYHVFVQMTLTAPGCGMGEWLRADARNKILSIPGVKEAQVEVVFDPPWHPGMMSPALRRALNMM